MFVFAPKKNGGVTFDFERCCVSGGVKLCEEDIRVVTKSLSCLLEGWGHVFAVFAPRCEELDEYFFIRE